MNNGGSGVAPEGGAHQLFNWVPGSGRVCMVTLLVLVFQKKLPENLKNNAIHDSNKNHTIHQQLLLLGHIPIHTGKWKQESIFNYKKQVFLPLSVMGPSLRKKI